MTDYLPSTSAQLGDFAGDAALGFPLADVPMIHDTLPDGHDALALGDLGGDHKFISHQGDNAEGAQGTCGLVSCVNVLHEFGVDTVDETEIVHHALQNLECNYVLGDPDFSGGTTFDSQARVLSDYGVPAHAETNNSLEGIAEKIESGHGMIIEVNAGILWDDPNYVQQGNANHAITVRGVARDPQNGGILGFYIADSGRGVLGDDNRYISAELMQGCHVATGGLCVVTEATWPDVNLHGPIEGSR